jgi:peptidoglycan/xylan/chitin deacetylase (PgdA/CDA1 family)
MSAAMGIVDPDEFERRPAYRKNGMYLPALFIMGIATAVLGYLLAMQTLGWKMPTVGGVANKSSSVQQGVVLYVSPNSRAHFTKVGGNYETLIVPWRKYFEARGQKVKEVLEVAGLADVREGVLILPSALALSDEERSQIMRFHSEGGGVLTTWATGSRNGNGDWQGWEFLNGLGAQVLGEIGADNPAAQLVLNGDAPVSYTSPAGKRVWLGKPSERFLRLKGENTAARIMEWTRIPDPARAGEGALVFAEKGIGRSVVMAFAESGWDAQAGSIHTVLDDCIAWLQRKPAIVKAPWPNGKRSAELIEMDTEQGFPNALRFASMMRALNYRGSFYVLTSSGQQYPDVLQSLARDFDIGYHGDIHDGFKDQASDVQKKRLEDMMAQMKSVVPEVGPMQGFRAPLESYDATTEKWLVKNGLRHHVVDPGRLDARLPEFAKIDGVADALVLLPRTQRDDINLSKEGWLGAKLSQALIDDFDLSHDMGGLGLLSIHSQNYANDAELTLAMTPFLAHLKKQRAQLWLASGTEIADWWRERERLKLSARNLGRRLEFNLSVTGKKPLQGGSLTVILPKKGIMPVVQALKVGLPKPTVQKIDDYRAAIVFDSLNPGDYAYQATFEQ